MIKNQKGFSAIEALLILIIFLAIGGTGYYVHVARNNVNKSLDNAANASTQPSKNTSAKGGAGPQDWLKYNDADNGITFSYPIGWKAASTDYDKQTVIVSSPDLKEETLQPFGSGTQVTAGAKITIQFQAQNGQSLDEFFSNSFAGNSYNNVQKESRQIDSVPGYEYEFGYESPVARHIIFNKGTQYSVDGQLDAPDVGKNSPYYETFVKVLNSVDVN